MSLSTSRGPTLRGRRVLSFSPARTRERQRSEALRHEFRRKAQPSGSATSSASARLRQESVRATRVNGRRCLSGSLTSRGRYGSGPSRSSPTTCPASGWGSCSDSLSIAGACYRFETARNCITLAMAVLEQWQSIHYRHHEMKPELRETAVKRLSTVRRLLQPASSSSISPSLCGIALHSADRGCPGPC